MCVSMGVFEYNEQQSSIIALLHQCVNTCVLIMFNSSFMQEMMQQSCSLFDGHLAALCTYQKTRQRLFIKLDSAEQALLFKMYMTST